MKTHQVEFIAYGVTETDGYTSRDIAYFTTYADAQKCVDFKDSGYRAVNTVNISKSWTIYESFDEYPLYIAQKRDALLLRLTSEERELLGV
jgi:hypothetical protein